MDFIILPKWFHEDHMVLNLGKFNYIVIGVMWNVTILWPFPQKILNNNEISSSNEEKLLASF